jgi:hypothetical protein
MQGFTAVDLTPQCEVRLEARYEYGLLEQIESAPELIGQMSGELWRCPESFEFSFPQIYGRIMIRWCACAPTSGIAILRDQRQTFSVSLLASGLDTSADKLTIDACQQHIVRQLHGTRFEASFDLLGLAQRPLVATIGLFIPEKPEDRKLFALADRCFAAAYFRKLGLV